MIVDSAVDTLMYFVESEDSKIRYCTLQSLGSVCIRHYELMTTLRIQNLYHDLLLDSEENLRVQTLQNIELYLQEEEIRMIKQDQECKILLS